MVVNVSGRHFAITETIRQKVADFLQTEFGDISLKIISGHAVLDVEDRRRIKVGIHVNIKGNHTAKADVEGLDFEKVLATAVTRVGRQARKLLKRRISSKQGERFVDREVAVELENDAL